MAYVTVADLRADGVTGDVDTAFTDDAVQEAIDFASEYIERVTGQFFEVRNDTRYFDGTGTKRLALDVPLLSLTTLEWLQFGNTSNWSDITTKNVWRVYNRIPQDQKYPKIEIFNSRLYVQTNVFGVFPKGPLNIRVTGSWGFVENTGTQASPTYVTPKPIIKAVKILACVWMESVSDGSLLQVLKTYGVTEERTKHHYYKLADAMGQGEMTGIPAVDIILRRYKRSVGAANV